MTRLPAAPWLTELDLLRCTKGMYEYRGEASFLREDWAIVEQLQLFFIQRSGDVTEDLNLVLSVAKFWATCLARGAGGREFGHRFPSATDDDGLALLRALDQPRKMRLRFVDVNSLRHAKIIG